MKYIILLLLVVFTFFSCSSSKELSANKATSSAASSVKSYGANGKIMYAEEDLETKAEEGDELAEAPLNVNPKQEEQTLSTKVRIAKASPQPKEQQRSVKVRAKKASKNKLSRTDWEPYRDPNRAADKKKNGFAIAGFVLSFFYFLAPLAIVFSAIGLQSEKRGLAIAGLVISCAVAALIIGVLFYQYLF